jgi:hypothetical protein
MSFPTTLYDKKENLGFPKFILLDFFDRKGVIGNSDAVKQTKK